MSGGWPLFGSFGQSASYKMPTPALPQNSKGAWSTIVAALPFDVGAVSVPATWIYNPNGAHVVAVDIGVGPVGSEVVIVNNLASFYGGASVNAGGVVSIPLSIKAGSRVSVRGQSTSSNTASSGIQSPLTMTFFDTGFANGIAASVVDSLGFQSSSTTGAPASYPVGSKGSFAQIIASTPYDYAGFFAIFGPPPSLTFTVFGNYVDIAIGPAGAERIILADWSYALRGDGYSNCPPTPVVWTPIPAGSRLSYRGMADSGAGNAGCTIYGIRQ